MDIPFQYYLFAVGAALFLVAVGALILRRGSRKPPAQNPYVESLKLLLDGNRGEAFEELQRAVKAGGAPTDAYIRLGNLLRERGEGGKALQIHQSLTVKTDLTRPEKIELFESLAEDYARLGNSDKAVRVLESAIRNLTLRDPAVFATLAKHYHLTGSTEKAYEALKDCKRYGGVGDRELALYLASLGEQSAEKGDGKAARKLLQRALKHQADCAPALMALGNLAQAEGHVDEAIASWRKVAMITPQLAAEALEKLERLLYEGGRFSQIEKIYTDVRDARAGDQAANLSLAAFYKKQGRGEDAIQLLEDYLAIYPESVRGALLLASFYSKYRDDDTLEHFFDESLKTGAHTAQYRCEGCDFRTGAMRWHCPRCNRFDSFTTNHDI